MKHILLLLVFFSAILSSCGQELESSIENKSIVSINGFTLREDHFNAYVKFVEQQVGETSTLETQIALKAQLKEAFLKNPETMLQELNTLKSFMGTSEFTGQTSTISTTKTVNNEVPSNIAEGHKIVRQVLGNDIGQMQFDVAAANTFRQYVVNSLLTSSSGSYDKSVGGSGSRRSTNQTQFCADGTYTEALSGSVNVDVDGAWADSHGTTYINGYWDVATLPNGMMIIIMYSTHPYVLEDWPNGIIPFIVAKHGVDFIALPGGDLYRRTANQYCN